MKINNSVKAKIEALCEPQRLAFCAEVAQIDALGKPEFVGVIFPKTRLHSYGRQFSGTAIVRFGDGAQIQVPLRDIGVNNGCARVNALRALDAVNSNWHPRVDAAYEAYASRKRELESVAERHAAALAPKPNGLDYCQKLNRVRSKLEMLSRGFSWSRSGRSNALTHLAGCVVRGAMTFRCALETLAAGQQTLTKINQ